MMRNKIYMFIYIDHKRSVDQKKFQCKGEEEKIISGRKKRKQCKEREDNLTVNQLPTYPSN